MNRCLPILILLLFSQFSLISQDYEYIAKTYIQDHLDQWNLERTDIDNWILKDRYESKHNGVQHLYLHQSFDGILIKDAIINVNIMPNGKVVYVTSRFISNLSSQKRNTLKISAELALEKTLEELKIQIPKQFIKLSERRDQERKTVFQRFENIDEDIVLKLIYIAQKNGELNLSWETEIHTKEPRFDAWKVYINAETGKLINKTNLVLECTFDAPGSNGKESHSHYNVHENEENLDLDEVSGESYRVFPITVESPNHGTRILVSDPADAIASPFGWHDTDGTVGAEFTITRGNNVHAQEDQNGNNGTGFSPDGGASLVFDYTLDIYEAPNSTDPASQNLNSSLTNLFFWNNVTHDVFYHYGFDEASGNFQENNYGNGGLANDPILADGLDGSDSNNARFFTSVDGTSGRMEMYLWTGGGSETDFMVNSPGNISGMYSHASSSFGPTIFNVTGDLVLADDGTANGSEACNPLTNGAQINGKIAVIDRGNCEFGTKVLNAENAGAIAVIVCNNVPDPPINMGPGADGDQVTIPSIMLSQSDCSSILAELPNVNVTLSGTAAPDQYDGSFDNGIIVHEYGHGISIRLTGGPSTNSCLTNEEQGGEGWSDFFGLVMTHDPSHTRNTARGIGTFAIGQATSGGGIRPYPYTTDMAVNPSTYDDIKSFSVPHGVGSVLCTMLWDMYWDLIDVYGYDPDLYHGTGGNNIAIQLVMDGLKLQPCSPGFVDVRDAIIAADQINNGGVNECLIWNAFARRGLGVSAVQGSSSSRSDGTEAFDSPGNLKIDESISQAEAFGGEIFTINSGATCGCNSRNNVQLRHELPEGMEIISINEGVISGNAVLSTVENLAPGESVHIEYTARMPLCSESQSVVISEEGAEGNDQYVSSTLLFGGNWEKSSNQANTGNQSWYAENLGSRSDFALSLINPVTLSSSSILEFYHQYNTDDTDDGGVVEISIDNGSSWQDLGGFFTQNAYPSAINSNSNILNGRASFTGDSNNQFGSGFIQSIIDLSSFEGENVLIRFRFASDFRFSSTGLNGWYIDDIMIRSEGGLSILGYISENSSDVEEISYPVGYKPLEQNTIYVDQNSTGSRYGADWDNAFSSIKDAIELKTCNENVNQVWIASGIYVPTDGTDRTQSFELTDGLSLYGGFNGTESLLTQRNIIQNPTVLSGDIGILSDDSDNSLHVVKAVDVNSAILDGFTIEAGNADGTKGAGIYVSNASPNFYNCSINSNNSDNDGGAVSLESNSNAEFKDCSLSENDSGSNEGRFFHILNSILTLEHIDITDSEIGSGSTIKLEGAGAELITKGNVNIEKN